MFLVSASTLHVGSQMSPASQTRGRGRGQGRGRGRGARGRGQLQGNATGVHMSQHGGG